MAKRPDAAARERARRQRARQASDAASPLAPSQADGARDTRRAAASMCAWCGGPIELKSRGRIPKWCSPACRQRAWEQTRAAASGRSAVTVVERVVQVPVPTAAAPQAPRHGAWAEMLRELAQQLDNGRIYPRDLPDLHTALTDVLAAYNRMTTTQARPRR